MYPTGRSTGHSHNLDSKRAFRHGGRVGCPSVFYAKGAESDLHFVKRDDLLFPAIYIADSEVFCY